MNIQLLADFWIGVLILAGAYAILALGIQLNIGFTGLLNLGQSGFMAIGAYTTAILSVRGWPLLGAFGMGLMTTVVFSVLLGLPTLRLDEDYFAIVTIAAASIVTIFAQNLYPITGGMDGLTGFDNDWVVVRVQLLQWLDKLGLGNQFQVPLLIVVWATFLILAISLIWLQRTAWGRTLLAVREDEEAASALGKNVRLLKLQSLGISALLSAIAGVLIALNLSVAYPDSFALEATFIGTAIVLLGGLGSYGGVAFGAITVWVVLESSRFVDLPLTSDRLSAIRFLFIGVALVGLAMFRPQGLFGNEEEMLLRD